MFKTGSNQNKADMDKLDSLANDDELRSSIEHISREAGALQKLASEHGYDFLSYILKIVIMESEIISGKQQPNLEESHIDVDNGVRFIC